MSAEFPNVFLLRTADNRHFVSAPLADLTVEVDQAAAGTVSSILEGEPGDPDPAHDGWRDFLRDAAAIAPPAAGSRNYEIDAAGGIDFQPTGVTLSLTTGCNLRCVYCYIHGGEQNRSMPVEIAEAAIRFIADNAARRGEESIGVDFHGEGEPTFDWPLFKSVVEYAETLAHDRGLRLELSLQTNALWNATQREFICGKFDEISISLDGLDRVQHEQRPTPNGKPSFPTIRDNLLALSAKGAPFGIRSTVMPNSLDKMESLIDFLLEHTQARTISFEPIHLAGRGDGIELEDGFHAAFAARLIEVMGYGRERGMEVGYSGCSHIASRSFCGATGDVVTMTVMADGTVSSCYEVPSETHRLGEFFVFGRFDQACRAFVFDQERLRRLANYRATDNSPCGSCFAQWSCHGDCLTQYDLNALLSGGCSSRCSVNKAVATGAMILDAEAISPESARCEEEMHERE